MLNILILLQFQWLHMATPNRMLKQMCPGQLGATKQIIGLHSMAS